MKKFALKSSIAFLAILSCAQSYAAKPTYDAVNDPRYGLALFDYYNGDYMGALTELLIAKESGGIVGHGDNPLIMEGGFALAYGMQNYATDIFETTLASNRSKEVQNAAWMYVAKIRYRNHLYQDASVALEKISKKPAPYIRDDVLALRINVAIREGKLDDAEKLVKKALRSGEISPYHLYNMASAYSRDRQFANALKYYNKIDFLSDSNARIALYDRTKIAAGYAYLLEDDAQNALGQFDKVGLESPLANSALLGYGWAYLSMDNYRSALKPWLRLTDQDLLDANTQEALIALPYAYEKMGLSNLAIKHFRIAESIFANEIQTIDAAVENLNGESIRQLLQYTSNDDLPNLNPDEFSFASKTEISPQYVYLTRLFSKNAFQTSIDQLRDLISVEQFLTDWELKLSFYREMLRDREFTRASQITVEKANSLSQQRQSLVATLGDINKKIADIESNNDFFALINGDEKDLYDRASPLITLARNDELNNFQAETARRTYGVLLWDVSSDFSHRLWELKRQRNGLREQIDSMDTLTNSIADALSTAPDMQRQQQTITATFVDIEDQKAQLENTLQKTLTLIALDMKKSLQQTSGVLEGYLAQTRLSIARLSDIAHINKEQNKQRSADDAEVVE